MLIPSNDITMIRCLAYFYGLRYKFHKLVKEVVDSHQVQMIYKDSLEEMTDIIECLSPNHVFAIVISSNLEEYKRL